MVYSTSENGHIRVPEFGQLESISERSLAISSMLGEQKPEIRHYGGIVRHM